MTTTDTIQDFSATFAKVSGAWRVQTSKRVEAGTTVLVAKRGGTTKRVVVTDEGTEGCDYAGNTGYWFYSFRDETRGTASAGTGSSTPSGWSHAAQRRGYGRRRACVTGGNCSSFGNGESCGADDCDGY